MVKDGGTRFSTCRLHPFRIQPKGTSHYSNLRVLPRYLSESSTSPTHGLFLFFQRIDFKYSISQSKLSWKIYLGSGLACIRYKKGVRLGWVSQKKLEDSPSGFSRMFNAIRGKGGQREVGLGMEASFFVLMIANSIFFYTCSEGKEVWKNKKFS